MVKHNVMVYNLYWLRWNYITYKLVAFWYLNKLNKLGRYCYSHMKVVESRGYISSQVQGCNI